MVLGQFPPKKVASNPNPNPSWMEGGGVNFPRGQLSGHQSDSYLSWFILCRLKSLNQVGLSHQ